MYNNGKEYESLDDLKDPLNIAWDSIDISELHNLVDSMPRRLLSIIERRGAPAPY